MDLLAAITPTGHDDAKLRALFGLVKGVIDGLAAKGQGGYEKRAAAPVVELFGSVALGVHIPSR
jgi:hypothetical protein